MALVERRLGATIGLAPGAGNFREGGNVVTLPDGLRMSAVIQNAGGLSDGVLNLTIFGMTKSLMNQLSTLGMQSQEVPRNPITLKAGDSSAMPVAFEGYVMSSYADFNAQPEVAFYITAHTLGAFATPLVAASSYKGPADVATIMAGYANQMGLRFENSGVQTKLSNTYVSGSVRDQAQAIVKSAGIAWNAGEGGLLAIWPKNGSRSGEITVIAPPPRGGMMGYPMYTATGLMLRTLYDPTLSLGQEISVESSVLPTGQYSVRGLTHSIDCEMPGGKWETSVVAFNPKAAVRPI